MALRPAASAQAAPAEPVPQPRSMMSVTPSVVARQRPENLARDEQVLRPVEERERRAFAGRRQRAAFGEPGAALDVAGRERAQRTRHLAHRQIGEMPALECLEPGGSQ